MIYFPYMVVQNTTFTTKYNLFLRVFYSQVITYQYFNLWLYNFWLYLPFKKTKVNGSENLYNFHNLKCYFKYTLPLILLIYNNIYYLILNIKVVFWLYFGCEKVV